MLNRITLACLVTFIISGLSGCSREHPGVDVSAAEPPGHASEASSYTTSSDGGVLAVLSEDFFVERKEIIPIGDGPQVFFVLDRNTIQACSPSTGCSAPQALNHTKDMPAVCRGTDINDALANARPWYLICSSIEPAPVEESTDGKYKSKETIAASVPWLLAEDFSRGRLFRARFKVRAISAEQAHPEAAAAQSKCELIEEGEAETRQECQSGNFNACRDIAGWVANKVMEGCSSGSSSSVQNEETNQEIPPSIQPQPSVASPDVSSSQEQRVAEGAAIDITSRNMNPPRYPPAAARAGIGGVVHLLIDINGSGAVVSVSVERSSGNRDLDRAAIDAARKWKFRPSIVDGVSVSGRVRTTVEFGPNGVRSDDSALAVDSIEGVARSFSPSFSCSAASMASEHAICADEELAALDRGIADAYAEALRRNHGDARAKLVMSQRAWVRRRDADCGDDIACLKATMDERSAQLERL